MVTNATPFPRITRDRGVVGGRPRVRDLRVSFGMSRGTLGDGVAVDDLLVADPHLQRTGILDACRHGAGLARERAAVLASPAGIAWWI